MYGCPEHCEQFDDGEQACCAGAGAFKIFFELQDRLPPTDALSVLEHYKKAVDVVLSRSRVKSATRKLLVEPSRGEHEGDVLVTRDYA